MISASQLSTFEDCPRKWAWTRIAGLTAPPNASALLGTRVHAILERYLATGEMDYTDEAGYIAATGIEHLPPPSSKHLLEEPFTFTYGGVEFTGIIDLLTPSKIYDHKTTSDLFYAKTAQDLETDIQANIYARKWFIDNPNERTVNLQWTYMRTKGARKSLPIVATIHRASNANLMDEYAERGAYMEELKKSGMAAEDHEAFVKSLAPNVEACNKYGGCPFAAKCNLSPKEIIRAHAHTTKEKHVMEEKKMSLKERLAARQAAAPQDAPAINAPPVPAPEPPPPAPATAGEPTNVVPLASTEAPKRGRPKKVTEAQTAPAPASPPPQISPNALPGYTLFLGCIPLNASNLPTFEAILLEAQKRILESKGVSDYRFIQYEGAGVLAQTVAQVLDEVKPQLLIVRDPATPEAKICNTVLTVRANGVIVGLS